MKKLPACAMKKFTNLQLALISGAEIRCPTCKELLEQCNFDQEEFNAALSSWLIGDRSLLKRQENNSQEEKKSEDKAEDPADEGAESDEETKIAKYLKMHEGVIQVLPPGSFGKRHPYRCLVCKTRGNPDGKVGEMGRRKFYSIEHFIGTHVESSMHLRYLKQCEANNQVVDAVKVKCQGLDIYDSDHAGKLRHRLEFKIWAQYANLAEATHQYTHDPHADTWIVKSSKCEEEVEPGPRGLMTPCKPCRDLGGGHSVPWLTMFEIG